MASEEYKIRVSAEDEASAVLARIQKSIDKIQKSMGTDASKPGQSGKKVGLGASLDKAGKAFRNYMKESERIMKRMARLAKGIGAGLGTPTGPGLPTAPTIPGKPDKPSAPSDGSGSAFRGMKALAIGGGIAAGIGKLFQFGWRLAGKQNQMIAGQMESAGITGIGRTQARTKLFSGDAIHGGMANIVRGSGVSPQAYAESFRVQRLVGTERSPGSGYISQVGQDRRKFLPKYEGLGNARIESYRNLIQATGKSFGIGAGEAGSLMGKYARFGSTGNVSRDDVWSSYKTKQGSMTKLGAFGEPVPMTKKEIAAMRAAGPQAPGAVSEDVTTADRQMMSMYQVSGKMATAGYKGTRLTEVVQRIGSVIESSAKEGAELTGSEVADSIAKLSQVKGLSEAAPGMIQAVIGGQRQIGIQGGGSAGGDYAYTAMAQLLKSKNIEASYANVTDALMGSRRFKNDKGVEKKIKQDEILAANIGLARERWGTEEQAQAGLRGAMKASGMNLKFMDAKQLLSMISQDEKGMWKINWKEKETLQADMNEMQRRTEKGGFKAQTGIFESKQTSELLADITKVSTEMTSLAKARIKLEGELSEAAAKSAGMLVPFTTALEELAALGPVLGDFGGSFGAGASGKSGMMLVGKPDEGQYWVVTQKTGTPP